MPVRFWKLGGVVFWLATILPSPSVANDPPQESSSSAAPVSAEALEIAVDASVKEQIDKYIRNSGQTGKYQALAIKKDGSDVTTLFCSKVAFDNRCGGWTLNQAHVDEQALRNCGGAECVLLYSGTEKATNVVIVTQ